MGWGVNYYFAKSGNPAILPALYCSGPFRNRKREQTDIDFTPRINGTKESFCEGEVLMLNLVLKQQQGWQDNSVVECLPKD